MSLHCQSWAILALIAALCLTQSTAQEKDRAPEWKEDSDPYINKPSVRALEGYEVKMSCPVKGRPKPDVVWYKDNQPFFPRAAHIRLKGNNLKFENSTVSDSGNYTCVAQNTLGKIEFTYIVEIDKKVWPLEVEVSSNITVVEGESASFYCRVLNDKNAKIQWLRFERTGGPNPPPPRYLASADESPEMLVLHDIGPADAGQYTCLIGNEFGSKYQHMYLTVLKPTTTTSTTTTTTTPTTTTTTTTTTKPTTTTTTRTTSTTTRATTMAPKKKSDPKKKNNKNNKKKDKKKKNKKKDKAKNKDKNVEKYNFDDDVIDPDNDFYDNNQYNIHYNSGGGFNSNTNMYEPMRPPWNENDDKIDDDEEEEEEEGNVDYVLTTRTVEFKNPSVEKNPSGDSSARNASKTASTEEGEIGVWTLYIIVGSVAGGVLLAGLVAIAIALCCQREEESPYKSTSV